MSEKVTLIINVPVKDAKKVRAALGNAGAGKMGNYSHCSFSMRGIGRFLPEAGADPHLGEVGKLEEVEEERILTYVAKKDLDRVIEEVKKAHPYEEVPIEIYPLL